MSALRSQSIWWEGPAWLAEPPASWPEDGSTPSKPSFTCCTVSTVRTDVPNLLQMFSSLPRLLRSIARLRRLVRRRFRRAPAPDLHLPLTVTELDDAFLACVRLSQASTLADDLRQLQQHKTVQRGSSLYSLSTFLDEDGVLRVGGRLQHSTLPFHERHPPVINGACPLAKLIISWANSRALHGGHRLTSAYAARRAWLLGGSRKIKAWIRRCVVCTRLRACPASQVMAPLTASRVTPSRAFGRTGVDYAGPFQILSAKSRGIRTSKGYIAVFVCLTTKAVHLELAGDLTAASFLGALTRFASRRGRPSEIWSDNATCFRRADAELREALLNAEIDWNLVAGTLAEQGTAWHFIPPGAPHFGGLWEAAVKSVKGHLRRVIGSRHLTFEEFSTVLCGIEMVLNSRPLVALSGDPGDINVLTPSHFLIGAPADSIIEAPLPTVELDKLAHWELVRGVRAQFWARWSREYLNTLQQRPKWRVARRNFAVGDIVVILDPTLLRPDGRWPLGRVTGVRPGSDGHVRAATVRTAVGEYDQPVTKLALLPIASDTDSNSPADGTRVPGAV